jgi:hypothetical protein
LALKVLETPGLKGRALRIQPPPSGIDASCL